MIGKVIISDHFFTPHSKFNLKIPKDESMGFEMAKLAVGSTEVLAALAQGVSSLMWHQKVKPQAKITPQPLSL